MTKKEIAIALVNDTNVADAGRKDAIIERITARRKEDVADAYAYLGKPGCTAAFIIHVLTGLQIH